MVKKKTRNFLLLIVCIFGGAQNTVPVFGAENKLPEEIEFRRHFSCYHCNVDWGALTDLENNPILNACLSGATYKELESLQIAELTVRLQKLQSGDLIRKNGDKYKLAFPAIIGEKRSKLQEVAEEMALKLLPVAEKMVREINPHLKGRDDMMYHVLWSIVMDGPIAWQTVKTELDKKLKKDNSSIGNIAWVMYPSHTHRAGTNTYDDLHIGPVIITWSLNTPMPPIIHQTIKRYETQLIQSAMNNQPLKEQKARQTLAQYGLVDKNGVAHIYIIDVDSEEAQTYKKLGSQFGQEFMAHLNIEKVTDILGISPEQSLVIVYHENCYEILKQLSDKKKLEIPKIVLKARANPAQVYRLISFIRLNESNYLN